MDAWGVYILAPRAKFFQFLLIIEIQVKAGIWIALSLLIISSYSIYIGSIKKYCPPVLAKAGNIKTTDLPEPVGII